MPKKQESYIDNTLNDSTTLIKITDRILSHLRELEAKIELQEELLLDLRKNQFTEDATKSFKPIRGIHGLADFLGVSPVTAQKLKNSGKIPFAQFERVVLFDPEKVIAALESNNQIKE